MDMDLQNWADYWPYAVIMIVIASWVLYRYVAPQSWREWTGAGLVQAFIIALYAEMYGFPLTIYLLTGFLEIEIPAVHYSGHLWATLLGYGRLGAVIEMLIGYAFVAAGILMLVIGWRQVYHARRYGRLATDGLYGVVRHPQYTGIWEYQEFRARRGGSAIQAMAFVKRSPNRTANCDLAMAHSRGGMIHSFSERFKTRKRSFVAASSLGKWPLARTARRSLELSASMAFVVYRIRRTSPGKA